jgi:hypothetical protein
VTQEGEEVRPGSLPGWIFVTAFLLLCVVATGLTRWNYTRHVFSSGDAIVLAQEWPESRIAVTFPSLRPGSILVGHVARVTAEHDSRMFRGEVVSVDSKPGTVTAVIKLVEPPAAAGSPAPGNDPLRLPTGQHCEVTVDTTVPLPENGVPSYGR